MDIEKLFATQKALDEAIKNKKGLQDANLLEYKILALLTELGELANEWRGFKFWSEDRSPRVEAKITCSTCGGTGDLNSDAMAEDAEGSGGHEYMDCNECNNSGTVGITNPLLNEFVDCLHFTLSIGNDLDVTGAAATIEAANETTTLKFNNVFNLVGGLDSIVKYSTKDRLERYYNLLLGSLIDLGGQLGFTLGQIEAAYYDKNKINHARQESGY